MPQATLMEFILDQDPEHRSTVYFWHAFADEEARERMIIDMLNSLEIVDQTNAERYIDRFQAPLTPHAVPVTSRPPASLRAQRSQ
jgi:hypothetical protein